ncbi:MAG: hypothetical protein JHC33_14335 [Ignisphaera sp.]|nr:hypothetical protein [Ignisphaera sp.]
MSMMNKLGNCHNVYQGTEKRVLCVCSAGLLRSPTMARVLAETYNYNTRAAGMAEEYALIDVNDVLIEWADEIVVAEDCMGVEIMRRFPSVTKYISLDLPDRFERMNPTLVKLIKERYAKNSVA